MEQSQAVRPLRVALVVGSTRQGRVGERIGRWFADRARQRRDIELAVLDLLDYDFPARYPAEPTGPVLDFVGALGRAEAYVLLTPEYNRSFPASLKQAVDYAYDEWQAKPVGFVSYGCRSDGMFAVEALRTVFTELNAVTMRNCVTFDLLSDSFDEAGQPREQQASTGQAVCSMLDQLVWWGLTLREGRAARPYVS